MERKASLLHQFGYDTDKTVTVAKVGTLQSQELSR